MFAGESGGEAGEGVLHRPSSMRPRHVCRGKSWRARNPSQTTASSSMRPRHVCRGKRRWGKVRARAPCIFNEAPACLPGKGPAPREHHPPVRASSMRPRHVCRGKHAAQGPSSSRWAIFNEAPACLPGKAPPLSCLRPPRGRVFNEAPACLPGKVLTKEPSRARLHLLQ